MIPEPSRPLSRMLTGDRDTRNHRPATIPLIFEAGVPSFPPCVGLHITSYSLILDTFQVARYY
jgi:hypothetical protein